MMAFEDYFSFEAIVGDLIRWRVKGKGVVDADGRRDVARVLPPRKAWSRAGANERKGMLRKVWGMLPQECMRGLRRYKGKPFSYCGFLENAARPTNMARRRAIPLPYSEL